MTEPSVIDFEQAVIGAILLTNTALERVGQLKPEHFYSPDYREIYQIILTLANENLPVDIFTVCDRLKKSSKTAVMTAASRVSSTANIEYHCAVIFEKYVNRQLISLAHESMQKLLEPGVDVFKIQQEIITRTESYTVAKANDFERIDKSFHRVIKKIESIQASEKSVVGIDTGFQKMNELTHGWHGPDLIIIAGRPSTGKTAFGLQLAMNVVNQKIPVAFFSQEMSTDQLTMRAISEETGVYQNYLTKAEVSEWGWNEILNADFNKDLYIDDTGGLNILDFKEKLRRAKRNYKIEMAFVDYLQLMKAIVKGNREQEITAISQGLKNLAKELNIPIVALAQFSREMEKEKREPRLSDLRESGSIEQEADIIIGLHNEDGPYESTPKIKAIWMKHRNGPTGYIEFLFDKGKQQFTECQ